MIHPLSWRTVAGHDHRSATEGVILCANVPFSDRKCLVTSELHSLKGRDVLVGKAIGAVGRVEIVADIVGVTHTLLVGPAEDGTTGRRTHRSRICSTEQAALSPEGIQLRRVDIRRVLSDLVHEPKVGVSGIVGYDHDHIGRGMELLCAEERQQRY